MGVSEKSSNMLEVESCYEEEETCTATNVQKRSALFFAFFSVIRAQLLVKVTDLR